MKLKDLDNNLFYKIKAYNSNIGEILMSKYNNETDADNDINGIDIRYYHDPIDIATQTNNATPDNSLNVEQNYLKVMYNIVGNNFVEIGNFEIII